MKREENSHTHVLASRVNTCTRAQNVSLRVCFLPPTNHHEFYQSVEITNPIGKTYEIHRSENLYEIKRFEDPMKQTQKSSILRIFSKEFTRIWQENMHLYKVSL